MIRFEIQKSNGSAGTNRIDCEADVSFKRSNPWFRFCDVKMQRTVEFDVPATDNNRILFDWGEDPAAWANTMRKRIEAQMIYDGGVEQGTLAVTGYKNRRFSCVFYFDAQWLDDLQGLKLSETAASLKGRLWSSAATAVDADQASGAIELIKYRNGQAAMPPNWQYLPSVNVQQILRSLDTYYSLGSALWQTYPADLWLVGSTLNGGTTDTITMTLTSGSMAISQSHWYTLVSGISVEWAESNLFGVMAGGGSTSCQGFEVQGTVNATFGSSTAANLYLIQWDSRLKRCKSLGRDLANKTVKLVAGKTYFFAYTSGDYLSGGTYYGWQAQDLVLNGTATMTAQRDGDLADGEMWYYEYNCPDMTVFEFLKAAALAAGMELYIDTDAKTIGIDYGYYGVQSGNVKNDLTELKDVVSVDEVSRCVAAWGSGTRKAVVAYDSEDYVKDGVTTEYDIANDHLDKTETTKIPWSEGASNDDNVNDPYAAVILDVDYDGSGVPKLAAKRPTLARAVAGHAYLQRVEPPQAVGYDDMAQSSTMLRVKVLMTPTTWFSMTPQTTYRWRGQCYVWTDASWTDGVATLTLQKVSQQTGTV